MKECSRNKLLVGLYEDAKESNPARPMCDVSGCVHPLRPQMRARGKVYAGSSVEAAVTEACSAAGIRKRHMKYGIAQIGTRDLEKGVTVWKPVLRKHWTSRTLKEGELLRFRMLPQGGGGGGGKNPLRSILMVVVAVVAIAVSWGVASAPIFGAAGALAGMGSYTKSNGELCLLARRGHNKSVDKTVPQIVMHPRNGHSVKPDEVMRRIERLFGSNTKKIELFARRSVDEWDCWGDEA